MAKGYTTMAAVQAYLGITLTPAQSAQATALMGQAEAFVDSYTRRSWSPSTVTLTGEQYDLLRDWVYLRSTPVVAIQSVTVRTRQIGDAGQTLTAGTDYELQNAATGFVVFNAGYGEQRDSLADAFSDVWSAPEVPALTPGAPQMIARTYALISYTASQPVPADIAHATTLLVAHDMALQIDPTRYGLDRKHIGQRAVSYDTDSDLYRDACRLLDQNKRGGVFG